MPLTYGERFILRKALLIRRKPEKDAITFSELEKFFRSDLAEQRAPTTADTAFEELADSMNPLLALYECVEDGLLETPASRGSRSPHAPKSESTLRRTREGSRFLENLEPKLKTILDTIPMSFDGILDFLAMQ